MVKESRKSKYQNIDIVSGSLVMTTFYREVFMCNIDSHPLSVGGSVSTSATKKKAKGSPTKPPPPPT